MAKVDRHPILPREINEQYMVRLLDYLRSHAEALNAQPIIEPTTVSATTHTFREADLNMLVRFTSGSATTATVPPDSSVPFAIGSVIHTCQYGAGLVTIAAGSGVTVRTRLTLKHAGQYAMCSILKLAVNEWVFFGDMAAT